METCQAFLRATNYKMAKRKVSRENLYDTFLMNIDGAIECYRKAGEARERGDSAMAGRLEKKYINYLAGCSDNAANMTVFFEGVGQDMYRVGRKLISAFAHEGRFKEAEKYLREFIDSENECIRTHTSRARGYESLREIMEQERKHKKK